jgi:hypothetical protein
MENDFNSADYCQTRLLELYNQEIKERTIYKKWYVDFEFTPRYSWFLFPTIEINTAVKELSFNFLCVGVYLCFKSKLK